MANYTGLIIANRLSDLRAIAPADRSEGSIGVVLEPRGRVSDQSIFYRFYASGSTLAASVGILMIKPDSGTGYWLAAQGTINYSTSAPPTPAPEIEGLIWCLTTNLGGTTAGLGRVTYQTFFSSGTYAWRIVSSTVAVGSSPLGQTPTHDGQLYLNTSNQKLYSALGGLWYEANGTLLV